VTYTFLFNAAYGSDELAVYWYINFIWLCKLSIL